MRRPARWSPQGWRRRVATVCVWVVLRRAQAACLVQCRSRFSSSLNVCLWDRCQPQRFCRVLLEQQVELTVGEAVGPHCLREGAYAVEPAVFFGGTDLGPEFRQEAELRSNLADRVHAPALKRISEIELDERPELRGFLHLLDGHLSGEVEGMRGDHMLHALTFRFAEDDQGFLGRDVARG